MQKTTVALHKEDVKRKWYVIDADGVVLGRLATTVVNLLRGKGKVLFTPHIDCGDYVIVINAEKVKVTGKKETAKLYYRHSAYPGGLKTVNLAKVRETHPERIITTAVRKMLRNNRLNRQILRKLKVYKGPKYREVAQQPEPVALPKYQG